MSSLWLRLLLLHWITITLCLAVQFNCDRRNVSCGCAFKNVEINTDLAVTEKSIPHSWSMMVSIRYDCHQMDDPSTHCCAGTLLNNLYILTSASCFGTRNTSALLSSNLTIAAGTYSLHPKCPTTRVVEEIIIHPKWTSKDHSLHNLALLRLSEPLDIDADIFLSRACLTGRTNTMSNSTLALVSWNVFNDAGGSDDQVLQQLSVHPFNNWNSVCAPSINNSELAFCAGRQGGLSLLSTSIHPFFFSPSL